MKAINHLEEKWYLKIYLWWLDLARLIRSKCKLFGNIFEGCVPDASPTGPSPQIELNTVPR